MTSAKHRQPLRVLVVTPFGTSADTGGAEKWLAGMLTGLPAVQWRVLLLKHGPFRDELRSAGIRTAVHPTGPSMAAVVSAAQQTRRVLRYWRPDVVVGNGVKAQLVTALATLTRRTPTMWVKHDFSFDRTLARPLGWLADTVVATAQEVGAASRRRDAVLIYPPTQVHRPSNPETAREQLQDLGMTFDERPVLVMAGRLVPYKGVDDAIAALAAPGAGRWRLVVVGDEDHSAPGERQRLAQLARAYDVAERVTFLPPVPGLADLFGAFDALAVLTKPAGRRTPGREGFGMAAFEAMQAAIPVIAVAGSPVARRLDGVAGIVVPPASPNEIAGALGRLSDPQVRHAMGRAGQNLVRGYPDAEEATRSFYTALHTTARKPWSARLRGRLPTSPGSAAVAVRASRRR